MNGDRPETPDKKRKITHLTNGNGEIDYGHAWRYFSMGFIDEYGRSRPIIHEGDDWTYLPNKERNVADEQGIPDYKQVDR